MPKYEIRKVVFINSLNVESYTLDTDIKFDVYGVYHREFQKALDVSLLYWDEDFDTLQEAEDWIKDNDEYFTGRA